MKPPILCILALLLAALTAVAQKKQKPQTERFPRVDLHDLAANTVTITASETGGIYYVQIGHDKKVKVGKAGAKFTRDSAKKAYFWLLDSLITKKHGVGLEPADQNEVLLFSDFAAAKFVDSFFPAKIQPPQIVGDTVMLDPTHFLGILQTSDNQYVLSEYTLPMQPGNSTPIYSWDSTGKLTNSNYTVFRTALLQQNLPKILSMKAKAGKVHPPQLYLLYDKGGPVYDLIESDGTGSGTNTPITITPAIAAAILDTGKLTNLTIDNQKLDVQRVKTSSGAAPPSPTSAAKPRASPKGRLIAHQQLNYGTDSTYNIESYLYLPSPSDTVLLSVKGPGKPIPDTAMPADFSMAELKDWVRPVIAKSAFINAQTDNLLSIFAIQTADRTPFLAKDYLAEQQKPKADTNQAKPEAQTAGAKKDTAAATSAPKQAAAAPAPAKPPIPSPPSANAASSTPDSIKAQKAAAEAAPDSLAKPGILNNITFLNAFNFDFTGKLSTSYLGVFNIFAPEFLYSKKLKSRFGIIAGIEKINYANANINTDSSQVQYTHQYVLANPVSYDYVSQTIAPGSKYYYQFNKYSFLSKNTVWSLYFQPTWRTHLLWHRADDPKVGLYVHLHCELLVNHWTTTISSQNISTDTAYYGPGSPPANQISSYLPSQYSVNATILTENFGAGLSYYVAPFYKDTTSHFFIQGTLGVSLNSPNFAVLGNYVTATSNNTIRLPSPNGTISQATFSNSKMFYLVRAIFLQSLSDRTELIIGTTIRGIFGPASNAPQYAVYVGLNLDLSILKDLFSK